MEAETLFGWPNPWARSLSQLHVTHRSQVAPPLLHVAAQMPIHHRETGAEDRGDRRSSQGKIDDAVGKDSSGRDRRGPRG